MIDRRAVFFALAAVVCAVLILVTPADLRWVPIGLSITYVVLALLSFADHVSRAGLHGRSEREHESFTRNDQ